MKLIHLSDLHLGKRVNGYQMLEDQKFILKRILGIIDEECADCVVIAGDIYDKPVPLAEAVWVFDEFLTALSIRKVKVCVVSGNHDSAERIAFGSRLMEGSGIHMSPVYDGNISKVTMDDDFGLINIYMIPYIKPVFVRKYFDEEKIGSYNDALKAVIGSLDMSLNERNIAVAHQFITGADRTESEEISIGGLDNVDATLFEQFDYAALGHIHRPQKIAGDRMRYCGTPLKYSFSEINDKKSVTVVDMKKKGDVSIKTVPLIPRREMCEIKGSYNELTSLNYYKEFDCNDYFHITLTDEEDVPEALGRLRVIYPNIMKLDYDNQRTRSNCVINNISQNQKSPIGYLKDFYEMQNNMSMSDEQINLSEKIIEKIWEK